MNTKAVRKKPCIGSAFFRLAVEALAVALLLSGCAGFRGRLATEFGKISFADNMDPSIYTIKEPLLNVAEDYVFELPMNDDVDLEALLDPASGMPNSVRVYTNGSLTQEYPVMIQQGENKDGACLRVMPYQPECLDLTQEPTEDSTGSGHQAGWFGSDGYYLVRYVGQDGNPMGKAEVTYFTVQEDKTAAKTTLAAPAGVHCTVTGQGSLAVEWTPVENAGHYDVYLLALDQTAVDPAERYRYLRIASTAETSFDTVACDASAAGENQNTLFADLTTAASRETAVGEVGYLPNSASVRKTSVAVVAVGSDPAQQSPVRFHSINPLLAQLPVAPLQTGTGLAVHKQSLHRALCQQVRMADNTVASLPLQLDFSRAEQGENGNFQIPYTIKGTKFSGTLEFAGKDWPDGLEQIRQAVEQAQADLSEQAPHTGMPQDSDWADRVDWDALTSSQQPADTMPDVAYNVNGTRELVLYLARNLMAGNSWIDVTQYVSQPGAPDAEDAAREALYQNPLLLLSPDSAVLVQQDNGHTLVAVCDPTGDATADAESTTALRQQLDDFANELVTRLISETMTDAEKVDVLNDYLADTLTFDAAEGDGTAQVLLADGSASSVGYAQAFKLLAEKAGIPCLYVTGNVQVRPGMTGSRHAWDLVQMDGIWKVVDVTWNDTDDGSLNQSSDRYLMLDLDDPLLAGRSYDTGFMLDSMAPQYLDSALLVG